ncbi:BID domain-containing T4SS effector [Bartonella queenslandensis]|uniref:BID domain-containing T4SS effector n=1 Tax=Bartonella queenslandensis TaxID=481138 RepID=UPI00030140E9|nr:BID domain-containing T4SS effector [Bartonella queenslandensis]
MKKDHLHPFPSSSIQELIKLYEQAAAEVSGPAAPAPLPKEKPSKSKRLSTIPEEGEERQSLLRAETVTEEVAPSSVRMTHSPMPLTRSSSTKSPQEPETTRATVTSQRKTRILSEEEIIQLLPHHSLVRTYQEEIQRLSASAYGNSDILQEKMQEIQRNPAAGEELSWRMTAHPESLAKLSGTNMFGFKNRARRQAEESFSALCVTVDGYTEAVKQARESLLQSPEQELKNYEHLMGKAAVAKLLKKPDHREKESLSEAEISTQIHQHSKVRRHHAQIQYWCKVVFGNENILQSQIEELFQNPETIEQLAQQLAGNPKSFNKYAGRNFCGFKNQARRHAESGLSHLIDATDNYATAVAQVRESLSQTQQTNQERHEASSERAQVLHQKQSVSQSVQRPETSTVTHERATTSTQQEETDFRPRKTASPKAVAFAS